MTLPTRLPSSGLSSPGRAHAHRGEASGCGRHTGRLRCVAFSPAAPDGPLYCTPRDLARVVGVRSGDPKQVPSARAKGYRTVDVVMAHLAIVGASRAAYGTPRRERRSTPIIQTRIAVPRILELSQRILVARARA